MLVTKKFDKQITSFRGNYYFLSNIYPCNIIYKDISYKCVESAFQAQKDPERSKEFASLDGFKAKALGKRVKLRSDWEKVKLSIMYEIVATKFTDLNLNNKLVATKDYELIESNTWSDTFWGTVNGKGLNYLGQILMYIRELSINR